MKPSEVIYKVLFNIITDDFNSNSNYIAFSFKNKLYNGISNAINRTKGLNVKFIKIIWEPKLNI